MTNAPHFRRRVLCALGGLVLAAGVAATATPAQAAEGTILAAGRADAIPGSYLVVFKDTAVSAQGVASTAASLAARHGGTIAATYTAALRGFSVRMAEPAARQLAANPAVAYVHADTVMSITGTQSPTPSWGLDRIDQRALPLNNSYTYPNTATNVHAY
ncbi:MAG TPA: protease inhibitor I9 family protein, partial [Micromonosporaceae bacterium]|nr:protease inhibitor I9 family protein [Micromonosporaceae bacterium]